ncbi:carboxylesterase/lipase family protein [Nitrospirillum amazonense]|uniref:carboxylesterase/lipase family protein n=1 Tax=Nitrospirillum amazonense TaxID=28077 RepID=UPI002412313F|nr:carboxylesterase/lipase family protein [Nitrospirillum amazonense]MDG3442770.1 carboxylesterase/lipase family protein [Nitrospirillum amazonense]
MLAMDQADTLRVRTEGGDVLGMVEDGVRAWRGIPYAAPPVGELRFRAPRPVVPWRGIRAAHEFGPIPMQPRGFEHMGGAGDTTPISEDCLTLNITAPLAPARAPRPVVVWLYGGAFALGGSRGPLYRGDRIVKDGDVIFVSLNYRIGVFGFSDFSAWSMPARPLDSNVGLRDQVAALAWVKRNIAAFGGDPANVTLAGHSAGAMSVLCLMCAPVAAGLFHRAFVMSPAAQCAYGPQRHAGLARDLLTALQIDHKDKAAVGRALHDLPADRLVEASFRLFFDKGPDAYPGVLATSPVIDGDFLPWHPVDAFRQGRAHPIPLVIGTMAREGAILDKGLPLLPSRVNRLDAMFQATDPAVRGRVAPAYCGYPSRRSAVDMGGDFIFWAPSVLIAEGHADVADTWMYRIDYATPLARLMFGGATHALDLPLLFGTTGEGDLGRLDLFRRQTSKRVSQRFQGAFLNFADGMSPGWPTYDADTRLTRIIDTADREEGDPRAALRVAWGDYRGPQ